MTGSAARATRITDLRCGNGHGDQAGQKERGQSGQPDSTVNGADTRTRDFHGVPLEVTASGADRASPPQPPTPILGWRYLISE